MANLAIHIVGSVFIFTLGLWHLVSSFKGHLKTPREYTAKLWHTLPFAFCKHLELYLQLVAILFAITYNLAISTEFDPLIKGTTPVHRLVSLQSAAVLCVFLILVLAVLASESNGGCRLPIPGEALFLIAASGFGLQWVVLRAGASLTSEIEGKCESLQGATAALCCVSAVVLSSRPKAFVADVALSSSLCLQGLWFLQSGLSLHVESFVPQGCHRLLDVPGHVEGSTQCDLEEYKLRAFVLLDLLFVFHVIVVVLIVVTVCGLVGRFLGVRRYGGYEPLDNSNQSNQREMFSGKKAIVLAKASFWVHSMTRIQDDNLVMVVCYTEFDKNLFLTRIRDDNLVMVVCYTEFDKNFFSTSLLRFAIQLLICFIASSESFGEPTFLIICQAPFWMGRV